MSRLSRNQVVHWNVFQSFWSQNNAQKSHAGNQHWFFDRLEIIIFPEENYVWILDFQIPTLQSFVWTMRTVFSFGQQVIWYVNYNHHVDFLWRKSWFLRLSGTWLYFLEVSLWKRPLADFERVAWKRAPVDFRKGPWGIWKVPLGFLKKYPVDVKRTLTDSEKLR